MSNQPTEEGEKDKGFVEGLPTPDEIRTMVGDENFAKFTLFFTSMAKVCKHEFHVHEGTKENCWIVGTGEALAFKVFDNDHVGPMIEKHAELTGNDKDSYTATQCTDRDYYGAFELLKDGSIKLLRDGEVKNLEVMMFRNDEKGFLIYLKDKDEDYTQG